MRALAGGKSPLFAVTIWKAQAELRGNDSAVTLPFRPVDMLAVRSLPRKAIQKQLGPNLITRLLVGIAETRWHHTYVRFWLA